MKQFLISIVLVTAIAIQLSGQGNTQPSVIKKADYFDKSPPLREMKVILPGERKRTWKDGVIENKTIDFEAIDLPDAVGVYENLQQTKGVTPTRGPLQNFDGVANLNGVYPPDTDGDVGPDHYFQMINLSFAIWDKVGNRLYGPVDNSTLWSGFIGPWTGTNDGDPIILYDEMADRWMASQFALENGNGKWYQLVAISETGDPLGSYYRYAFEFNAMNDYPKIGVWPDGYYCSFNFFSQGFIGSGIAAFEREKMLEGDPDAQMVFFGYFENKYSWQPSDMDGENMPPEGSPNYCATANINGSQQFEIYEFKVDWDNPSNSTFEQAVSLDPGYYDAEIDGIPQPNTNNRLDVLSRMLMYRLAYRSFEGYEVMVANHTVNVNNVAGIKWYEFRKEAAPNDDWYIYQQGVYAPGDGIHRWMGSIAVNADGTIALGYSVSSSSIYPSIRYTGRPAGAPLGEMTYDEIEVVTGFGSQTGLSRWGDYACMSVDPVDDTTFWFTTEYMRGGWKTRISSFNFGPIEAPVVNAGDDATICQNSLFTATGSVVSGKSWQWGTSGDGIFATPTNLTTYYLGGQQDYSNGNVTLTLTAEGYVQGLENSDDVLLSFTLFPSAFAGNDTVISTTSVYFTNGSAENTNETAWSTEGDGVFEDATLLQTVYTPGGGDILNGSVELTLDALPMDPCTLMDSDDVTVTLDPLLVILTENMNSGEIAVFPNPSTGQFTIQSQLFQPGAVLEIMNSSGSVIFTEQISNDING
nr:hypothetical protein [Bacteroidota bacterium]